MFQVEAALIIEKANALLGDSCPWKLELLHDDGRRISGVSLYYGDIEEMNADRLYVADSIVPDPPALLCVPPRECSAIRACELLQTAFDECRNWHEECLRLIVNGADIDVVLDAAASNLANPTACLDEAGDLVHWTGTFSNSPEGTVWENIIEHGCADVRFLSDIEQLQLSRSIAARKEVIEGGFENDADHRFVVIPLRDGDTFRGSLVAIDINEPITPGQKGLMRIAGQLVLLAATRRAAEDSLHGSSYYVRRLLEGGPDAKRLIVEQHFARIGWKTDDSYMLFRFEAPEFEPEASLVTLYERQVREALPSAMWIRHQDGLVALGRKRDFDATSARKRAHLERLLSATKMLCGISSCAVGFGHLEDQHTQCLLALHAKGALMDGHVGYFDELYPAIVRHELDQVSSIRSLCHPAVLRLAESERDQGGTKLATLKTFFLNGRNVSASSRALGIHRNTMLYRLEKLQEEIGEDLNELDEPMLTYLLISCLIAVSDNLENRKGKRDDMTLATAFINEKTERRPAGAKAKSTTGGRASAASHAIDSV